MKLDDAFEFVIDLNSKVQPTKLAAIFGININNIYQEHMAGRWGAKPFLEITYIEALRLYRKSLLKAYDLKKERMEEELRIKKEANDKALALREERQRGTSVDMSVAGLQEKQVIQRLRLDRVKEVEIWLKIAEARKQLIIQEELLRLTEPFIQIIKSKLVGLSLDHPEIRDSIEETLESLANLGERLVAHAVEDSGQFVAEMLNKEVDDELLELTFIPNNRDQ